MSTINAEQEFCADVNGDTFPDSGNGNSETISQQIEENGNALGQHLLCYIKTVGVG